MNENTTTTGHDLERMPIDVGDKDCLPPLADVLTVLGIAPFTRESVDRYQTKLADRLNSRAARIRKVTWVAAFACAIAAIVTLFSALLSLIPAPASLLVAAGLACLAIASVFLNARWDVYYWWPVAEIDRYKGKIPAHVTNLAKSVQRLCPEATAYIQYLLCSDDPFLMVALNKEAYYLDVWDERNFQTTNGGV